MKGDVNLRLILKMGYLIKKKRFQKETKLIYKMLKNAQNVKLIPNN
jgi:hypothetical protein